jgi:hypothetical protein
VRLGRGFPHLSQEHTPGKNRCQRKCFCTLGYALSAKNRVSDNVGPCQALLSALLHALKEERHFALIDGVAFSNRRLARNPFRSGHSVRPMHLFGRNFDHDY